MKGAGKPFFSLATAGTYLVLLLLPLLAFAPVLFAGFVLWDDDVNVTQNPGMLPNAEPVFGWWTNLDRPYQQLYIPLTYTVWRVVGFFASFRVPTDNGVQFSPAVFHAVNLLLHLCSVILVYWMIGRFVKRRWPAVVGALLFAVHPVQVEAVAWVTGLKDVLSGTLALAALYGFVRFAEIAPAPPAPRAKDKRRAAGNRDGRWMWFALSSVAFLLSMFAKPSTSILPVLAGLLGCTIIVLQTADGTGPGGLRGIARSTVKRVAIPLLPWLLAALAIAIETRHAQPASLLEAVPLPRPLIAADTVSFYIRLLFFPVHMSVDYGRTPAVAAAAKWRYVEWALPFLCLLAAFFVRKRLPLLLVGLLFFMAATLPVWGLVPFGFQYYSTVADRYLYLSMAGAALAAAALADRFWHPAVEVACTLMLLVLAGATFLQSTYWKDTTSLFTHTLEVNPRSFVAHSELGYLAATDNMNDQAVAEYEQAVRIQPTDYFTNYNWGNLLLRENRPAEALLRYRLAMRSVPEDAQLHNNAGFALAKLGQTSEATAEFQHAVLDDPDFAGAYYNLGQALFLEKRYVEAYQAFQHAVAIDPNNGNARNAMAQLEAAGVRGR